MPEHKDKNRKTKLYGTQMDSAQARLDSLISSQALEPREDDLLAIISGTLYSFCYVRFRFFGKEGLNVLALSPLAFPKIILGVALLLYFHLFRLVGTYTGLILGLVIVAAPFVVKTVSAAMYNFDKSIEEAAMSLGANEVQTFFKITLPLIKPGLISAAILAFIYTFGNLQVAVFLVGPTTTTVPVKIFSAMEFTDDPSVAAVAAINILLVMAFVIIAQKYLGAKALVKL